MIVRIKKKYLHSSKHFLFFLGLIFVLFFSSPFIAQNAMGINVSNASVLAIVNITNTEPHLYSVYITNPAPIDLNPGTTTIVQCNGSFFDADGYDDLTNVEATIFRDDVGAGASDDNNTHYTNFSCGGCAEVIGTGSQNGTCSCNFPVQYYASNGSWRCNMTISDSFLLNSSNQSIQYTVQEIVGIDVESPTLDYGNLSVTQVSEPKRENVTNIGNVPINVTLRGYGGEDDEIGINWTMICSGLGNISFSNQRYSVSNETPFNDMFNLTNQTLLFPDYTIPKRVLNDHVGNSTNATWWKLRIPNGISGTCNGTIIFGGVHHRY